MTEPEAHRSRPGMAFLGFAVGTALLAALVLAVVQGYFAGFGWHAGEYALAFLGVVLGAIVGGAVLKVARPAYRSSGNGLIVSGVLGSVGLVAFGVLTYVALLQWSSS